MDSPSIVFWEVRDLLQNKSSWKKGECVASPVIKKDGNTSWILRFYPAGDESTDELVFSLDRDNHENRPITVKMTLHLCHFTNPVKSYTLECDYEKDDDSFKCQLADVKDLARLRIFIPLSTLCVRVFLSFYESTDIVKFVL